MDKTDASMAATLSPSRSANIAKAVMLKATQTSLNMTVNL